MHVRDKKPRKIRCALIGCGAIAEAHLPVAVASSSLEVKALVDKSPERARELAHKYGISMVVADYNEIVGNVDAAVVALPHHLHAPVAIDLLQSGIHVLVEKPMALTASDCDKMIDAAQVTGATLAVGMIRRFFYSSQLVKSVCQSGILGDVIGFEVREGSVYNWPVTSDFMFRREAGGGVLADTGAHVLDLSLWWFGDCKILTYNDDAMAGVEADCEIQLGLTNGTTGFVELSRTRELRNTWIIRGERGILEVGTQFNPLVRLKLSNQDFVLSGYVLRNRVADSNVLDIFARQLEDFVDAIYTRHDPSVSGLEGKRAVQVIEACRVVRQPLNQPWMFGCQPD